MDQPKASSGLVSVDSLAPEKRYDALVEISKLHGFEAQLYFLSLIGHFVSLDNGGGDRNRLMPAANWVALDLSLKALFDSHLGANNSDITPELLVSKYCLANNLFNDWKVPETPGRSAEESEVAYVTSMVLMQLYEPLERLMIVTLRELALMKYIFETRSEDIAALVGKDALSITNEIEDVLGASVEEFFRIGWEIIGIMKIMLQENFPLTTASSNAELELSLQPLKSYLEQWQPNLESLQLSKDSLLELLSQYGYKGESITNFIEILKFSESEITTKLEEKQFGRRNVTSRLSLLKRYPIYSTISSEGVEVLLIPDPHSLAKVLPRIPFYYFKNFDSDTIDRLRGYSAQYYVSDIIKSRSAERVVDLFLVDKLGVQASPDLLIFNDDNSKCIVIQVKSRRMTEEARVDPIGFDMAKEFWKEVKQIVNTPINLKKCYSDKSLPIEFKNELRIALKLDPIYLHIMGDQFDWFEWCLELQNRSKWAELFLSENRNIVTSLDAFEEGMEGLFAENISIFDYCEGLVKARASGSTSRGLRFGVQLPLVAFDYWYIAEKFYLKFMKCLHHFRWTPRG